MTQKKKDNLMTYFLRDVFLGWSKRERIYALALLGLQILVYIWNPDSLLGFIAGITGTACVILAAKRKISNYVFGFVQTAVGLFLGLQVALWGESIESAFYLVSQFIGFAEWRKNMVAEAGFEEQGIEVVETLKFTPVNWIASLMILVVGTLGAGYLFKSWNGTQPFVDAFTLVTAIVAQIIMLKRYREQWLFWFVLNIVSIYQWFTLQNYSMVALYIAFIINNAYGYYEWTKGVAEQGGTNER